MKKSIIALALATAIASPFALAAEQTQAPAQQTQVLSLRAAMVQSWHLSDDKTKAFNEATQQFQQKLKNISTQYSTPESRTQRQAAVKQAREDYRTALSSVLDADQLRAYAMLGRHSATADHRPMGHGPVMSPAMMSKAFKQRFTPLLESWNLTPSAQQQVFAAQGNFMNGLRSQKTHSKEGVQQLLKQRQDALKKVLNAKQLAAFSSLTRPPMMMPPHVLMRAHQGQVRQPAPAETQASTDK